MNKPAIHLYTTDAHLPALAEICAGLEEEGVPWALRQMETDAPSMEGNASHWDGAMEKIPPSAKDLAYQAAQDSVLEVGIGLTTEAIALQIRRVPKEKPVFYFANPTARQCRVLGTNAARAVKKQRFAEICGKENGSENLHKNR